ncbi:MAG: hypothetical protein HQK97_03580, partial [Nitrospirae bacterium]|nr:hypothetical protein [Nitrospirota bacterium]
TLEDEKTISTCSVTHDEKIIDIGDKHIYLDTINAPIHDNLGNLIGIVMIGRDITQRVELERQIKDKNEKLEDTVISRTAKLLQYNRNLIVEMYHRKKVEADLIASRKRLRQTAINLQNAIEEDRKKIARELHDDMGQALTVLKIEIYDIGNSAGIANKDVIDKKIKHVTGIVDDIIDNMHSMIIMLRPTVLDDFGLIAAIQWQIQELHKRTGMVFEFDTNINSESYLDKLNKEYVIILYRVFQESVTNIIRHAEAEKVIIRLGDEGKSITMEVEDNGKGIDDSKMFDYKSFGILGMKERVSLVGGTMNINKGTFGRGTKIFVSIPLEKEEEEE